MSMAALPPPTDTWRSSTPVCHDDIFDREAVRNARAVDDALREMGPVVKLARENITMVARHEHVSEGLKDWQAFSSTSRPWHDPNSVRPEILLVDDPPRHTAVRPVIASALSPKALAKMATAFSADADALLREVKEQRRNDRCGRRHLAAVRLQGAARSARNSGSGPREHDGLRSHGVGDTRTAERAVPRSDGECRPGHRVGGSVLQPRESRPRGSRHADVPRGRSWRDHPGRSQVAGGNSAVSGCGHHRDDRFHRHARLQPVSRSVPRVAP